MDPVCTLVMTRLEGVVLVLLALLTNPAQPVNNAATKLRDHYTDRAHPSLYGRFHGYHFLWAFVSSLAGAGVGARGNGCSVLPELRVKNERSQVSLLLARRTDLVQGSKHSRSGSRTGLRPPTICPVGRVQKEIRPGGITVVDSCSLRASAIQSPHGYTRRSICSPGVAELNRVRITPTRFC